MFCKNVSESSNSIQWALFRQDEILPTVVKLSENHPQLSSAHLNKKCKQKAENVNKQLPNVNKQLSKSKQTAKNVKKKAAENVK